MTKGEQENEIAAMVAERNQLRRTIACLDNKLDRIEKALLHVGGAIRNRKRIYAVRDEGITGLENGPPLPPVAEIMETQNQRLDAKQRLDEVERRIDSV